MDQAVTMGSWITGHASRTPDKAALVFKGERITYAALDARARQVARGLSDLGVRKGDRVAVLLLNGPELL
jgi:fatty-acyl-CoA synthase